MPQPYGSGRGIVDVDHGGEEPEGSVVTALAGQPDGVPELERGGRLVAGLTRLQSVLDALRELGLPGVMRDRAVDLGGEPLVIGPYRLDQPLPEHLITLDERHPPGQHLVADLMRRHLD